MTTSQVLSARKIRVPRQALAHQPTDYKEVLSLIGGLPSVAKLQRGSQGDGVMILNDELAASTSLRSFEKIGANIVLQEYINTGTPACDLRIIVIDPYAKEPELFAYKRFAVDGDFRSNYSISKSGEKVTITDEERQLAIDSAEAVNCGICGVDVLRDADNNNKPYVCEVNGSPGLKGIETITGENIAAAIISYVIRNHRRTTAQPQAQATSKQRVPDTRQQSKPSTASDELGQFRKLIEKYRSFYY